MTGGYIKAGMHEVTYTEKTKESYLKAKAEGKSHWRVSSTLFSMLRNDVDCSPIEELSHLYDAEAAEQEYPKMTAHEILMEELSATNMVLDARKEERNMHITDKEIFYSLFK